MITRFCVPVAQLDRVAPSEGEGQAFESPQGRHQYHIRSIFLNHCTQHLLWLMK
jgi:hypothetical protein